MTARRTGRANRSRRGVGAIVGGVILAAIIFTTILTFFISILNNEKARTSYEILSAQASQDRSLEKLLAFRQQELLLVTNPVTGVDELFIDTLLSNDGSLPLIVSHTALYCTDSSCPDYDPDPNVAPSDPKRDETPIALNSREVSSKQVGPVSDGLTYRVDFITERGNVVSAGTCVVDAAAQICTNDPTVGGIPDFSISASPISIVLEVGNSGTSVITITSINDFSSAVTLSASSPAAGISSSFSLNPVTPPAGGSDSSTLTISTTTSVVPGTYTMIVTGVSGAITHSTGVSITVLEDDGGAITEGIIQGTGSLQLDFKAFGVIYPQLGARDGVDQTGWDARVASKYSYAHGYPGYQLMTITASGGANAVSTTQLIVVESARNLDQSGEDLILTRHTGINPSLGAIQGSDSDLSYICKEDTAAKTVTAYNENTAFKLLTAVPITADLSTGWTEMYFCTTLPGTNPNYYTPEDLRFANLTPLFLVARGDFADGSPYSQTIPYQAFTIGKGPGTSIVNTCLLSADTNTVCPAHSTNQGADTNFRYDATEAQLQSGVTVWLHLNTGPTFTNGIDVRWLHPDGTYETLLTNQPTSVINGNRNIPVNLPTGIICASPGTDEFHTLVFNDGRDSAGNRYIYYMTFRVDC